MLQDAVLADRWVVDLDDPFFSCLVLLSSTICMEVDMAGELAAKALHFKGFPEARSAHVLLDAMPSLTRRKLESSDKLVMHGVMYNLEKIIL